MARKGKRIPQVISKADFYKIIYAITHPGIKKITEKRKLLMSRNVMMVYFGMLMGLRPKEIRCIRISDINIEKKELYIPAENNKQRNEDDMPIPKELFGMLIKYLEFRLKCCKDKTWLFPNFYDGTKCVDRESHIRFFRNAVKKAGLYHVSYIDGQGNKRGNFTIYNLRHTFGTTAKLALKDIKKVKVVMRHYDPECRATMIYDHTAERCSRRELMDEIFRRESWCQ
jgi:integrase